MTRRTRRRFRVALVVILALLFQQVAVAAYACTLIQAPAAPSAMPGCAEMGLPSAQVPPPSALCQKHCAPDHSIGIDHATLTVPALALPPLHFVSVLDLSGSHRAVTVAVPIARSDPPPRLRYCSLLI